MTSLGYFFIEIKNWREMFRLTLDSHWVDWAKNMYRGLILKHEIKHTHSFYKE